MSDKEIIMDKDNSNLYIKMSDCSEIQDQRKKQKDYQLGDVIANHYLGQNSEAKLLEIIVFEKHYEIRTPQLAVWLPYQHQIQEMMPDIFSNREIVPLTQKLAEFTVMIIKKYHFSGRTMEQLWLAFYMFEKHGKVWNGDGWVKQ